MSSSPRLLDHDVIHIPMGAWRGRTLRHDGEPIGTADHGRLSDLTGAPLASVRRQRSETGLPVWTVTSGEGERVGSIIPATRINWRGKVKAMSGGAPLSWNGSMRLCGSSRDVAAIRGGAVIREDDGAIAAEVLLGAKRWFGTRSMWGEWTLRFRDCPDRDLRIMCCGWLELA